MAGQFDRLVTLLGIKLLLDEPLASLDISRHQAWPVALRADQERLDHHLITAGGYR